MVNLVKVGETSGNLDDVMQSLSEYYARIDDITNKLKQALTYPIHFNYYDGGGCRNHCI